MTGNPPTTLGSRLSPLLGGGFFRPLARPTAVVYVDCAERLIEAADGSGQFSVLQLCAAPSVAREALNEPFTKQLRNAEGRLS